MEPLSYMRLFVEVARTKSFRRAADVLDMPNSTLSRHIAELEKTIGLRLLHRSTITPKPSSAPMPIVCREQQEDGG